MNLFSHARRNVIENRWLYVLLIVFVPATLLATFMGTKPSSLLNLYGAQKFTTDAATEYLILFSFAFAAAFLAGTMMGVNVATTLLSAGRSFLTPARLQVILVVCAALVILGHLSLFYVGRSIMKHLEEATAAKQEAVLTGTHAPLFLMAQAFLSERCRRLVYRLAYRRPRAPGEPKGLHGSSRNLKLAVGNVFAESFHSASSSSLIRNRPISKSKIKRNCIPITVESLPTRRRTVAFCPFSSSTSMMNTKDSQCSAAIVCTRSISAVDSASVMASPPIAFASLRFLLTYPYFRPSMRTCRTSFARYSVTLQHCLYSQCVGGDAKIGFYCPVENLHSPLSPFDTEREALFLRKVFKLTVVNVERLNQFPTHGDSSIGTFNASAFASAGLNVIEC